MNEPNQHHTHAALIEAVQRAALESKGDTEPTMRRAIRTRAQALVEGRATSDDLPVAVARFVDAMVSDPREADVERLLSTGHADDGALEIAISTALGMSAARLEHGMRAIRAAEEQS